MAVGRRDLMTAISHDLRTLLSSLRAMVEAIDGGVAADPVSLQRCAAEMGRPVVQFWNTAGNTFAARFVLGE